MDVAADGGKEGTLKRNSPPPCLPCILGWAEENMGVSSGFRLGQPSPSSPSRVSVGETLPPPTVTSPSLPLCSPYPHSSPFPILALPSFPSPPAFLLTYRSFIHAWDLPPSPFRALTTPCYLPGLHSVFFTVPYPTLPSRGCPSSPSLRPHPPEPWG